MTIAAVEVAMAFREVGLMQVADILRRWQAGDSARTIARGTGLARDTVVSTSTRRSDWGLRPGACRRRTGNSSR